MSCDHVWWYLASGDLNYRLYRFPASDLSYYWTNTIILTGNKPVFSPKISFGEVQPHWLKFGHTHILSMGKFGHTSVVNWWPSTRLKSQSVGFMITVSSFYCSGDHTILNACCRDVRRKCFRHSLFTSGHSKDLYHFLIAKFFDKAVHL